MGDQVLSSVPTGALAHVGYAAERSHVPTLMVGSVAAEIPQRLIDRVESTSHDDEGRRENLTRCFVGGGGRGAHEATMLGRLRIPQVPD